MAQLRTFPAQLTDKTYTVKTNPNRFDSFWLKRMRDPRDLPFIYLTMKLLAIVFPCVVIMYGCAQIPWLFWPTAGIYTLLITMKNKSPFGLMLHCTSHRPWFKTDYKIWNKLLPWILGPFMGQSPETYFAHHIAMHHLEGNLPDDDSTTMPFKRDSGRDFAKYLISFLLFGVVRLVIYFNKIGESRRKIRNQAILGELLYIGSVVGLCFVNFWATLFVFILPFVTTRITMMLGNWAQHAFVDPEDPGNEYKNSVTCINHQYNHNCWNDGYHISHHVKPNLHWTEHPNHLLDNRATYAKHQAMVFEGIEFGGVWFNLMRKNYEKLADHLVNIDGAFASREEAIAVMKSRTAKIVGWQQEVGLAQ